MDKNITRNDILEELEHTEHPEIAASLTELGMILDVAVEDGTAKVAVALPKIDIPNVVREKIVESIRIPLKRLGLKADIEYFEMTEAARERFLSMARSRWKGSI
ncbi:MAG: DUF59 domain-containing protein [Calditrichaeota bacterium]|nr:DUF59 domain-containing protein [Calditrichota bacterium]RQW00088.1 MAG: DUF59 domain-containing protein [Calditrichota bacterium]